MEKNNKEKKKRENINVSTPKPPQILNPTSVEEREKKSKAGKEPDGNKKKKSNS